jgi:hypothetical protein
MSNNLFQPLKDKIFTDFVAKVVSKRNASSSDTDGLFNSRDILEQNYEMEEAPFNKPTQKVQRPGIIKGRSQRFREQSHYEMHAAARYAWNMEKENGSTHAENIGSIQDGSSRKKKKRAPDDYLYQQEETGQPEQKAKRSCTMTSPSPMQFC